jgi:type VI secretion system protein ImpH
MRRDDDIAPVGLQDLLERVRATPWKFGFFSFLRRFSAMQAPQPRLGLAKRPQQESLRLGQVAALTFAPREVAELVLPREVGASALGCTETPGIGNNAALPLLRVYGLGLLGPNGPLPLHYTELVRERAEIHHDTTLADFLDLFHHRFLSHMYRAWAQSQAAAGLDRADDETFSRYFAQLTGHDPLEIRDSVLPSHARLAASAHLGAETRHPDGLAGTLAHFFAVPVQLQEFVLHWIRIDLTDQTRLGLPRDSSVLGMGAIAGEFVADRQNKFRLILGPMNLTQYLRFTPAGEDMRVLVEWVHAFVGYEFAWEVELRVRDDSTPSACLGAEERLGWSTWLCESGGTSEGCGRGMSADPASHCRQIQLGYATGMVFEPESYLAARADAPPLPAA